MKYFTCFFFVFLFGCGTTLPPPPAVRLSSLYIERPASSMPKSIVKKGLTVGVIPIHSSRQCEKIFRQDLLSDGLIPLLLAFENQEGNNPMVILPKKIRLVLLLQGKRIPLGPVNLEALEYPIEREMWIESLLLFPWRLEGGRRKNGFLLFDARRFGWDAEEVKKKLKNALVEIPIQKLALPKPKDPKKVKDPARYRGETFTVKILL